MSVLPTPLTLYGRGALMGFVDYIEAIPGVEKVGVL